MQRVILLGASNLTVGFPVIIEILREAIPEPLEIVAAHGHGRSYGGWNRVLFRDLPGILQCRLWEELEQRSYEGAPPLAVITDVGNDLLYGRDVDTVVAWVTDCLQRLKAQNAEILLTALPLDRLERLWASHYYLMRTVLFPLCRIDWETMKERARALNEALHEIAPQFDAVLVRPRLEWYGLDPIHIRRGKRAHAWSEMIGSFSTVENTTSRRLPGMTSSLKTWSLRPAERRLLGVQQFGNQPAHTLTDGSTVWLY